MRPSSAPRAVLLSLCGLAALTGAVGFVFGITILAAAATATAAVLLPPALLHNSREGPDDGGSDGGGGGPPGPPKPPDRPPDPIVDWRAFDEERRRWEHDRVSA